MMHQPLRSSVTLGLGLGLLGGLGIVFLGSAAAMAQTSNFGEVRLSGGFAEAEAEGFTAGVYGLSNIASRDRNNDLCLGYADITPDHVLILDQDFPTLTITVDSGGEDTTLMIQGPDDNTLRCNDNPSQQQNDAQISDSDWSAGTYRIWVGAFDPDTQHNYFLKISE